MRLVTFTKKGEGAGSEAIGAFLDENSILDLKTAVSFYLQETGSEAEKTVSRLFHGGMRRFLEGGEEALNLVRRALESVGNRRKTGTEPLTNLNGVKMIFPASEVVLKAPVPRPGKLIAMGLNFYDHAAENKVPPPEYPVGFLKASTSIVGPGEPVPYPRSTQKLDYEIEMAIVIGKKGKDIPKEKAMEYVAGYTILNDLSARDIQSREMKMRLVLLSKGIDGLGPMGPYLLTRDEVPDPHNLAMELFVNDEKEPRQKSTTGQMVFKVPDLVAYWSQMTLEPGDIISSGTPGGVAIFRPSPGKWLLKPGDIVEARIEKLGVLRNKIIQ